MSIDPIKLAAVCGAAKERLKYQDKLEELKALHEREIRDIKKTTSPEPAKRSRTSSRTEVIVAAIKKARTPYDPHSILDAMRDLAQAAKFPQLIGYVPGEGFQWSGDDAPKYQKDKDALAAIRRHLDKGRVKAR